MRGCVQLGEAKVRSLPPSTHSITRSHTDPITHTYTHTNARIHMHAPHSHHLTTLPYLILCACRHHCRFCGRIFCARCSRFRVLESRCCLRCFGAAHGEDASGGAFGPSDGSREFFALPFFSLNNYGVTQPPFDLILCWVALLMSIPSAPQVQPSSQLC